MEYEAPTVRVFAADVAITAKYWDTVIRKNYSQPEKELMLAVLKDALMIYKRHMHSRSLLFHEAEVWFFDRKTDRLFSFETVCAVLGLSPEKIRQNLLGWKLNALSNLGCGDQQHAHGRR